MVVLKGFGERLSHCSAGRPATRTLQGKWPSLDSAAVLNTLEKKGSSTLHVLIGASQLNLYYVTGSYISL